MYNPRLAMAVPLQLDLRTARTLLLHAQGLLAPVRRSARKADVLAAIRRMGLLQIDTICVVARSPYLVLYGRLGPYEPRWLDELHAAGKLFEYWAHAMCWLPAEDWPLFGSTIEHWREDGHRDWRWAQDWLDKHPELAGHVLKRIRDEGALRSADFVNTGQRGPWWDWKGEKAALEFLFLTGELMIARRDKFQRVYDLRQRVRPDWDSAQALPREEVLCCHVRKSALALGVATTAWLRDYYRLPLAGTRQALHALLDSGELLEARIEGVKEQAYIHRDTLPVLRKAERGKLADQRTALLSPFDPLVWDRRRNRELFGFDYTIEVYTPGHKRQYGYFTLPILHQGALIGRLDPKAHRKDGVFEVKALHLEPGVKLGTESIEEIAAELQSCASWHSTPRVVIGASDPPALAAKLRRALGRISAAAPGA